MNAPRNLLVVQLRRLGDVLMTTPAVEALRRAYPEAKIDFLVEAPGDSILNGNPNLDGIVLYDATRPWAMIQLVRSRGYDMVIDFLGTPRSAVLTALSGAARRVGPSHVFHRWAYSIKFPTPLDKTYVPLVKLDFLRGALGIAPPPVVHPLFPVPEAMRLKGVDILRNLGVTPSDFVLAVMPFSRRPVREWPLDKVAAAIRGFHARRDGKAVLFWGGPKERERAQWIATQSPGTLLIPDTRDLKLVGGLMLRANAALTCDNGPKHLAQALGIPSLTVYGPVRPEDWNPPGDPRFQIIRREELFCIGCNSNDCPFKIECMTGMSADRVLERLLGFIDSHGLRKNPERTVQA